MKFIIVLVVITAGLFFVKNSPHLFESPPPDTPVHQAIDDYLAQSLIDPTSVMQYRVSDAFPCSTISAAISIFGQCVCFSFNSKNRMGAFVGQQMMYGELMNNGSGYSIIQAEVMPESKFVAECQPYEMHERSSKKISDLIHR